MKKLTKREKIMIYVMALVIIIGITILIYRPIQKKSSELENTNSDLLMQLELLQMTGMDSELYQQQLQKEKDRYATLNSHLEIPMSTDEMEQKTMKIVNNSGMIPVSSVLSLASLVSVPVDANSNPIQEGGNQDAGSALFQEDIEEAGLTEDGLTEDGLTEEDIYLDDSIYLDESNDYGNYMNYYEGKIELTLEGNVSQLMKFLDDCDKEEKIMIRSFSVAGDGIIDVNSETINQYYVELSYFMMPLYEEAQ